MTEQHLLKNAGRKVFACTKLDKTKPSCKVPKAWCSVRGKCFSVIKKIERRRKLDKNEDKC